MPSRQQSRRIQRPARGPPGIPPPSNRGSRKERFAAPDVTVTSGGGSELDGFAYRGDARVGAGVVPLAAGGAGNTDAAQQRASGFDHAPAAHRRNARPVTDPAHWLARLRFV